MTADQIRRHHRRHTDWRTGECPLCLISRARCLFKPRRTTAEAAAEATARNEANLYTVPVVPYFCIWCDHWHITSKVKSRKRKRRVQGAYRKWATARELARRQKTGAIP